MPGPTPPRFRLPGQALRMLAVAGFILAASGFGLRAPAADAPAASTATGSDLHTFTNDSGASFNGEILNVVGDEVNVKKDNNQTFKAKISIFSKADQDYICDWAVADANTHSGGIFSIAAEDDKGVITTKPVNNNTHTITTSWEENYQITLKNQTLVAWPNLQLRYIVITDVANFGNLPPNDFTPRRSYGTFSFDKINANESKNFAVEKVSMQGTAFTGNYFHTNGAPKSLSDKFVGVWIRVYNESGKMIQEWASDPDILKNERWTMAAAAPRGASGARGSGARGSGARGASAPEN